MDQGLIKDIIDWDVGNWSKSLDFWQSKYDIKARENDCLELGSNKGGLSLWLAIHGNRSICSDLKNPKDLAEKIHIKYSCTDRIEYQAINATQIPFENRFDIVTFKSILGGISRSGKDSLKKKTIDEIHKSLKPNGVLLFAENLEGSWLHQFMRKHFVKWGNEWNYLKIEEIKYLFEDFKDVSYQYYGFFAAFGRTEKQRQILSQLDLALNKLIPNNQKYIVFGIATKIENS